MRQPTFFDKALKKTKDKISNPIVKKVIDFINDWGINPFIRYVIDPLGQLLSAFWRVLPYCWASVFALLLLFGLLWVMDQGQDVMVQLSARFWSKSSMLFFLGTLLLAFFNWYFPLKNIHDKFKDTDQSDFKFNRDLLFFIPRLLAVLTILISGYSMTLIAEKQNRISLFESSTMLRDKVSYLIVIITLVFLIYGHKWIDKKVRSLSSSWKDRSLNLLLLSLITLVFLPVTIGEWMNTDDHILYLTSLALSPLALSILVYLVLVNLKLKSIGKNSFSHYFLYLLMILSFGVFIFSNLSPLFATDIGPAIVFVCTLISLVVVLNSIVLWIINYNTEHKQIAVILATALLFLLSFTGADYKYRVMTLANQDGYEIDRMNATRYTDLWLDNVKDSCDTQMTIYLVASHGGGIRAAYWTNLVLAQYMDDTNGSFYDHVFCLSGASGGMVGEGLFTMKGKHKIADYYVDDVVALYDDRDFLSPMIAKLLGFDLIRSVWRWWPVSQIPDRHRDLEYVFEQRLDPHTKAIAQQDYLSFWEDSTRHLPLLISTSTRAQTGGIAIYSPVRLDWAQQSHDLDIYDKYEFLLRGNDGEGTIESIPFMTAVLQSARFPVVSPPGSLFKGYQFVDAGFRDNIGAGVTLDMLDLLVARMKAKELDGRFKIRVLVINSAEAQTDEEKEQKEYSSSSTLSSPIVSFLNLRSGYHSTLKDEISEAVNRYRQDSIDVRVISKSLELTTDNPNAGPNRKHIFPLGWYLSHSASATMQDLSKDIKLYEVDSIYGDLAKYYKGFLTSLDLDEELIEFVRSGCSFELEHTILLDAQLRKIFKDIPDVRDRIKSLISDQHAQQLIQAANKENYREELVLATRQIISEIEQDTSLMGSKIVKAKKDIVKITAYNYFTQKEGDKVKINATLLSKYVDGDSGRFSSPYENQEVSRKGSGISNIDEAHLSALQTEYLSKTILPTQNMDGIEVKAVKDVEQNISGFFNPSRAQTDKSQVVLEPANSKLKEYQVKKGASSPHESDASPDVITQKPTRADYQKLNNQKKTREIDSNQGDIVSREVESATSISDAAPPPPSDVQPRKKILSAVEQMPTFGGCTDDECTKQTLEKYIKKRLKIPTTPYFKKRKSMIEMSFVVGKNGAITQIKRERSTTPCCEKETYEVIESMNKLTKGNGWRPGKHRGRIVPVRYKVVIPLY